MRLTAKQTAKNAKKFVAEGAVFLDTKIPDWYDQIELDSLSMGDECKCVLGQLGSERVNLDRLGVPDIAEGDQYVEICKAFGWIGSDRDVDDTTLGFEVATRFDESDADGCWGGYTELTTYEDLHIAWVSEIAKRRVA